jgi:hypothetical protein
VAAGEERGYDAFISYSHRLDAAITARLQAELQRFAKPWYRYQRMAGLLRQLDADMSRADSITVIHEIAADAEHLMRAENSDWFGVMRFHDVELITLTPESGAWPGRLFRPACLGPEISTRQGAL